MSLGARSIVSLMVIAVLACGHTALASERWFAASAGSDVVFGHDADAIATVLEQLRFARVALTEAAGVELHLPVHAFVVSNESALRELVPKYWKQRGARPVAASFVGPHAAFIAIRTDVRGPLLPTLLHEYAHLLAAVHASKAPGWVDEGVAAFWSTMIREGDQLVVGRPPDGHLKVLESRSWMPAEDLIRHERGSLGFNRDRADLFYAQAWATVHYSLFRGGPDTPLAFSPADPAINRDVLSVVRSYIDAGSLPSARIRIQFAPDVLSKPRPISEASGLAQRAWLLVSGEEPDNAVPLARRALSQEPQHALALEVMGTHAFLRNKPAEARSWLSRSLDADPSNHRAAVYLALIAESATDRERYLMSAVRANASLDVAWQRLWTLYVEDGRAASVMRLCRRQPWRTWSGMTNSLTCEGIRQ
jgi:hypothetical protein